jgi:hypothetical protein
MTLERVYLSEWLSMVSGLLRVFILSCGGAHNLHHAALYRRFTRGAVLQLWRWRWWSFERDWHLPNFGLRQIDMFFVFFLCSLHVQLLGLTQDLLMLRLRYNSKS